MDGSSPPPVSERSFGQAALRSRRVAATIACAGVTTLFAVWIGCGIGGPSGVRCFDDVVTAAAAFVAAATCARTGSRCSGGSRRFWLLLAAACAAWAVAETIWEIYDLALRVPVPVPSWADVGYLGAVPLAVGALVSHPSFARRARATAVSMLDGAAVATALLFLSWTLVLGRIWHATDLTSLGGIVAVAYPFSDVVMVFLVVIVIRGIGGGERFPLGCVLAGLMAMAISDATYTWLTATGHYATGNPVDTGWVAAYLALALGAFSESAAQPPPEPSAAQPAPSSLLAILLPVLMALGVVMVGALIGRRLDATAWAMGLGLTVLVLLRGSLTVAGGAGGLLLSKGER
jgi:diguanylate cyclase